MIKTKVRWYWHDFGRRPVKVTKLFGLAIHKRNITAAQAATLERRP